MRLSGHLADSMRGMHDRKKNTGPCHQNVMSVIAQDRTYFECGVLLIVASVIRPHFDESLLSTGKWTG